MLESIHHKAIATETKDTFLDKINVYATFALYFHALPKVRTHHQTRHQRRNGWIMYYGASAKHKFAPVSCQMMTHHIIMVLCAWSAFRYNSSGTLLCLASWCLAWDVTNRIPLPLTNWIGEIELLGKVGWFSYSYPDRDEWQFKNKAVSYSWSSVGAGILQDHADGFDSRSVQAYFVILISSTLTFLLT